MLKQFSIIFMFIAAFTTLNAGGWGKTGDESTFEGNQWSGVYFDLNDLFFTATLPNYSSTSIQSGWISMTGGTTDEDVYVIETSFNPGFMPPKTSQEFLKLIQDANPQFTATLVDPGPLGAKYAVDMIPLSQDVTVYWRFLSTQNRIIKMGTSDSNPNRQLHFFESIFIK